MKKVLLFSVLLMFPVLVFSVSWAQPKLSIPEPDFDFGYVPQHSVISHVFWLYSTGTDSLKVVNVRPG
ncbi:MAG: hypothetical protein JSU69_09170 [Candidatus Zixiibacteriota bacterium]|nr:MAG: hypothetical protein JSU69_09170 [candidate division Zixibacteria bacterium]